MSSPPPPSPAGAGDGAPGDPDTPGMELLVEASVAAPADEVWEALFQPAAMAGWIRPEPGAPAGDPSRIFSGEEPGSIRVIERRRHVRLTWRPPGWPGPTTLHVEVRPEEEGARVVFRQEEIPGHDAREARRAVLAQALDALLGGPGAP